MCDKLKSAILAACLVVPAFGAFSGSGGDYLAEFNLYPFMGEYDTYDPDAFDQTFACLFYDIMTDGNPYLWNVKTWVFEQGLCFPSAWYYVDNDQGYVYSETRDVRFELFTKVGRYVYEGLADYTDDWVDYHCNVLWALQNVSHWHDSCILTCEPVGDGMHKDEWSILSQDLNILIKDALDLTGDGLEVKAVQNLGDGYPWFVQRHDAWRTQGDYGMQSGLCGQNGNSTLDFRRTGAEPVLMEFDVAILSESGELNLRMHAGDKIERETLLTGTSHGWRSFTRFVYEDYDSVSFEFKRGNEDLRLDKINTALVDNLRVTKAIRIVFDPSWGGFKSGVRSEIWSIPGYRYGEFYPFPGESDLTPPRRDVGYVFEGWYADAEHIYDPIFDGKRKNGTGELITESTVVPVDISPTKVITLYARWSISPPPPHNPDPDPDEPDPDPEPEPSPDPAPNPGPDEPEPEPDPEPNPGFVRVDSQDENLILRSLSPLKGDKFSTEFSPGDRLFVDICIEVTSGGLPTRHRGPIDIEFVLSNGKVFSSVIKDGVNRELDKGYTLFKSLNLAPGDYTLTCRLDPEDKVKELTKSDNVLTVAFKVVPAWCNLVFGSADHIWTDLNKAGMAIGTSTLPLDFTDKVASTDDVYCHFCFFNESLSAIHAKVVCAVEVFRNGESVWKDTKTYSSLYEGESVHEGIHLNDVLALTPGSYTVKVSLDAEGVVAETDENDNVKICSFEVRPAASFRPIGGFHPTRAETMRGALFRLGEPIGIVELKIAKPKKNSSMAKVTGSLVGLDGKKKSIKGVCNLVSEYALYQRSTIDLTLPNIGDFKLEVGENGFAGVQGDYVLETASVGGRLATSLNFFVAESFASDVPNVVRQRDGHQFLPYDGLPIIDKNGKWVIEKAAKIKYAKVAKSDPPVYALTGYANAVNLCGLKLSYTQKTGLFKGAFTVFLLDESAAKPKLKKVTTDVRGIVVNGAGYGTATCKKLHCESSVTVK